MGSQLSKLRLSFPFPGFFRLKAITFFARRSNGRGYSAVNRPSLQEEFDSTKPRSRRFSTRDCCRNSLPAFCASSRSRVPAHLRWLSEVVCYTPAQQIVFQEYVRVVSEQQNRLQRLETELQDQARDWRLFPMVEAIQALRGVQFLTAACLIAELGDLKCNEGHTVAEWSLTARTVSEA
jgi:hypothetical protein